MKKKTITSEHKLNRPNCGVIPPFSNNTALTYALETQPDPLSAGIQDASLQFIISNLYEIMNGAEEEGISLAVQSITFGIPVGAGGLASAALDTQNYILSDTQNWTVAIDNGPSNGIQNVVITAQPGYSFPFNASLVLTLFGIETVTGAGNTNISVNENITPPKEPDFPAQPALTGFQVSVFPAGFYLNGLVASVYGGSQLVPVAQVSNGDTITLTWNTSVTGLNNLTVYWSDAINGQQSASPAQAGIWTSKELTCDTVFVLVATTEVDNQPMTLSRTLMVAVENPSLVASGLQLVNPSNPWMLSADNGADNEQLNITNSTNGAASLSMDVSGNIDLNNQLTVQQSVRINGFSTANSGVALSLGGYGSLNVDAFGVIGGRFTVQDNGNVGINNPYPTANLHVNGSTILNGTINAIGSMQVLDQNGGTYIAPTDGFVIGYVGNVVINNNPALSFTVASCFSNGVNVSAQGGYIDFGSHGGGTNTNSFTLPVSAGSSFSTYVWNYSDTDFVPAPVTFNWIPLGQGSIQTLERIGDAPPMPIEHLPQMMPKSTQPGNMVNPDITGLVDVLSDILGEKIDTEKKQRLHEAVRKIFSPLLE